MTENDLAYLRQCAKVVEDFWLVVEIEVHMAIASARTPERLRRHYPTPAMAFNEFPRKIATLFRAIEERDAIIHDLQQDGEAMHERIRQAERCEVVNCLRYLLQRKRRQKKAVDLYDIETQIIGCRGLVGNLLPPDQARAECERLRAKLRAIREQIGVFLDVFTHYQEQWPGLEPAMMVLRQMASEDTP